MNDDPLTELDRTMGRLTNERVVWKGDKKYFDCLCRCGRRRLVQANSFNAGSVTCCEVCVKKGLRENHFTPPLRVKVQVGENRVDVTMDDRVLSVFGFDIQKEKPSGKMIRTMLEEWASVLEQVGRDVPLTPQQWERLKVLVLKRPDWLEGSNGPNARVAYLIGQAGGEWKSLSAVQSVAVLAALRWALTHPDRDEWWNPDVRVGGAK